MKNYFDNLSQGQLLFKILIILAIIILLWFLYNLIVNKYFGYFDENKVIRKIKRLYRKYDYPVIDKLLFRYSANETLYYDAIVLGNKYFYIIEVKNWKANLYVDDDWVIKTKNHQKRIIDPVIENQQRKRLLCEMLKIDPSHVVSLIVLGDQVKVKEGDFFYLKRENVNKWIHNHEQKSHLPRFSIDSIEDMGNYLLDKNIKNRKIRKLKRVNTLKLRLKN